MTAIALGILAATVTGSTGYLIWVAVTAIRRSDS